MNVDRDQVLALAAAFQAISLVLDIAHRGRADGALVRSCLQGLVRPYQPNLAYLYGGVEQLRPGLITLRAQLGHAQDREFTRYAVVLLHLEGRLRRQPGRLEAVGAGLERTRRQAEYFDDINSGPVIAALAHLYSEQISPLRPRVMVTGERAYLEQAQNADLIRALLLAALRAFSFWREKGGSRLSLILRRRAVLQTADALLAAH